jgi:hypothetical protein
VARQVARGLPPSFDLADLRQIAEYEHWRQVQTFDPARGVPYQAYAYAAVRGAVQMACRRRQYRDATSEELSGDFADGRPSALAGLLAKEARRNVGGPLERRQLAKVKKLLAALPDLDAYLVRRVYLEGADLAGLEELWGMPLERRLNAAVGKLRRARLRRS